MGGEDATAAVDKAGYLSPAPAAGIRHVKYEARPGIAVLRQRNFSLHTVFCREYTEVEKIVTFFGNFLNGLIAIRQPTAAYDRDVVEPILNFRTRSCLGFRLRGIDYHLAVCRCALRSQQSYISLVLL